MSAPESSPLRLVALSDFNAANLASYLGAEANGPALVVDTQMLPSLEAADRPAEAGCYVVWFRAERVAAPLAAALAGNAFDVEAALADVDAFADQLRRLSATAATVLVASWFMPPNYRVANLTALKPRAGAAHLVMRMNLRLLERVEDLLNVHVLDAGQWMAAGGREAFNPRLWYMGKIPYANEVFRQAARGIKAALRAIRGESRKIVVVDLDNTLWGGLVGEGGWESLRLGGHDPAGEAYVDFQRALKALTNRGVLLAIASKNDSRVALDALRHHPEMVLRENDFAAMRINWQDKAENIADLLAELRLGPQSAVFVDDHPSERARVREALPEILVPDWPASPLSYVNALLDLDCFDTPALTDEDRRRGTLYRAEADRAASRAELGSLDDWLKTLDLCVFVEELNHTNATRTTQLLNKTNQMNLSTRRLSASELREWADRDRHRVWTFRVRDRFDDAGLTGILGMSFEQDVARIVDFVVSCRVLGRRVEETMLHHAVQQARAAGAGRLVAAYLPTERNAPCKKFLERSGLSNGEGQLYSWDTCLPYPVPDHVRLEPETVA